MSTDHQLVFVAGLHRSGTTPLARLLAAHPDVSGFSGTGATEDEGQHLQDLYPPARTYGGAGRFALDPAAHLTEDSPLATEENARRLYRAWEPHWDTSRAVLVEKSPPNLVMTRFLQHLFPTSSFVVVIRHPVVVALSTEKWRRSTSFRDLVHHWVVAHETFAADASRVERKVVLRYEDLVATPDEALGAVARSLRLEGDIPTDQLETHRSDAYSSEWARRAAAGGREGKRVAAVVEEFSDRVERLGYSLTDLSARLSTPLFTSSADG
ncbi:sulfotransferase [Pseudokineococcus marinus]|uniref:Sulfotransferase n=1 Tax=Pseudokineococcus marinus TaxID=351215 RepID=A0A849BVU3_9ACTN|nr:sulfotransferase [Pseudokineococcus marinus]NNH21678.1 sulfotransferase [Pseudokineococcus marinus]